LKIKEKPSLLNCHILTRKTKIPNCSLQQFGINFFDLPIVSVTFPEHPFFVIGVVTVVRFRHPEKQNLKRQQQQPDNRFNNKHFITNFVSNFKLKVP